MCPDFTDSPNKITRSVKLDGVDFTLAVDLNFYRLFQRLTGRNLFERTDARMTADEMAALIYCSARSGGTAALKDLSHEAGIDLVGALVHMSNLGVLTEAVQGLMRANSPPEAETGPLAETAAEVQPAPDISPAATSGG